MNNLIIKSMKKFIPKINPPLMLAFIVLIAWYISSNLVQFALIQGDSMLPTYHNMQLVLVDKHSNEFHYNDVIVFTNEKLNATLIKRIIAIPGDTVQIIDGIVYVNNIPSPFLTGDKIISYSGIASSPLHLSSDEYFVLGDNYEKSKDSRYPEIGCINSDVILAVKPGLTGWWQVSGRNNLTFGQRLVLETEYGEKASLKFDTLILAKTFKAVLKKVGSK